MLSWLRWFAAVVVGVEPFGLFARRRGADLAAREVGRLAGLLSYLDVQIASREREGLDATAQRAARHVVAVDLEAARAEALDVDTWRTVARLYREAVQSVHTRGGMIRWADGTVQPLPAVFRLPITSHRTREAEADDDRRAAGGGE